ncbi:MAG: DNA polymerase III subunit alpha [Planctomycetota bacterium]|nr:MAG: DNA polymerase III subunit alpha [Planctomycetota bacterium]
MPAAAPHLPAVFHLHVRSSFSLLEGGSSVLELAEAARDLGLRGFALTDRNALYGLPEYLVACERLGLAPVAGAHLDGAGGARAVLLPTSRAGYAALCRAITARHAAGPRFELDRWLDTEGRDLVVLSDHPPLLEALCGREDLYVELRRRPRTALARLARRLGLPLVATGDVLFARPEHRERHRVLRAIAARTTLGRLDATALAPPEAWLQPPSRLARTFVAGAPEARQALARTIELAERCRFGGRAWGYGEPTLPRWEEGDAATCLREAAFAGARARYGIPPSAPLPARVRRRLEVELELVLRKGFADYFLIVRDIVQGASRTCGRGSAAASLIAYALGITHVDPVRHDLFFERFLNEGRLHPPDIDIDFPWDERDAVLERVFARWGARAAMVCNHVRFRPRAALREVARSFGLPERDIAEVTARLPYVHCERGEANLAHTFARSPLASGWRPPPPWDRVLALATGIVGLPRHLSVHPGGVVITPDPLCARVPVETAPKGVPVIQWEKDGAEEAGLVKIDLLGNRSLAVIRDALAAARAAGADPPSYAALDPTRDPRCQELLARGETVGCFYVESPAMRQLQRRSRRGDFEHLVLHSSIVRPAANTFIREYLRRLHGGPWRPLHPELECLLSESLGLMAYQEDLARVSIALAGFDAAEADLLRKVLSKKERDLRLEDLHERFVRGARARGLGDELIAQVWDMMASFAGYSFCKAHSASYALVSFKCCWLRDRFPAEFLAAVLSNGGGYYSTLGYLGEARRLGLEIQRACVNHSAWAWTGSGRSLRAGLCQLRGLRREAGEALLAARESSGPFSSFEDLVARVPELERRELALLARAGALDGLAPTTSRAQIHWRVALLARRAAPGGLFARLAPRCPAPPPANELDANQLLAQEVAAYGLPLSVHPLELWRIDVPGSLPLQEALRQVGRRVTVVGWPLTAKLVQDRTRRPMEFVTLDDPSGCAELTVFPRVYARAARALHAGRPLVVRGRVEEDFGVPGLVAESVRAWQGPARIPEPDLAADRREEDLFA